MMQNENLGDENRTLRNLLICAVGVALAIYNLVAGGWLMWVLIFQ